MLIIGRWVIKHSVVYYERHYLRIHLLGEWTVLVMERCLVCDMPGCRHIKGVQNQRDKPLGQLHSCSQEVCWPY